MKIGILTTKKTAEYRISEDEDVTNDEICRAITYLKAIENELMNMLEHDFEAFKE